MSKWLQPLVRFVRAEDGPTAVEYAVLLALIIVVCFVAITTVGSNTNAIFANPSLNSAAKGGGS